MKKVLENYLRRVEWDDSELPARFYPFLGDEALDGGRRIMIDPTVAFGKPIIVKRGISTAAIAGRVDAGESVEDIAADYGLQINEIEEALIYESRRLSDSLSNCWKDVGGVPRSSILRNTAYGSFLSPAFRSPPSTFPHA